MLLVIAFAGVSLAVFVNKYMGLGFSSKVEK